jgi:hypothetical protein
MEQDMKITWLAAGSIAALFLTAGVAAADTQQFGPFADDRRYLGDLEYQSPVTFDTKAEVYGEVYEEEFDEGYADDEYFYDGDPELWVGMEDRYSYN